MSHLSPEYAAIKSFYAERTAKRSGVPLMNHIDEGIVMLKQMRASELAVKAYCLHPLIQGDADFAINWKALRNMPGISLNALQLAVAYREAANSYLCRPDTDHYTVESLRCHVGYLSQDLVHMLFADKMQNEKDFDLYHKGTHERSDQLSRYFCIWIDYLEEMEAELKSKAAA
ncbi:MAG: hypothetical protein RR740_00560 [Pseudomonas sp.]